MSDTYRTGSLGLKSYSDFKFRFHLATAIHSLN